MSCVPRAYQRRCIHSAIDRPPPKSSNGRAPAAPRRAAPRHARLRKLRGRVVEIVARPTEPARKRKELREFGFRKGLERDYEIGEIIGAGSFGTVFNARSRKSGREFAAKRIRKRRSGATLERHFAQRVRHEVDIYTHMGNSLNVAHLYDVFEDETTVTLLMEHCTGGELWRRIRSQEYDERGAARIVREILRTVSQFHANGVVIRDVKPENFLFATKGHDSHLKAIDFGIAQYCEADQELTDRAGTPIYVAPEVLRMKYGQKADVWSTGIVAYQLLTGRLPFIGDNGHLVSQLYMSKQAFTNKDVFRAILYADLDFTNDPWDSLSGDARQLLQRMLTRDPAQRPTAAEALEHPWFKCLDPDGFGNGSATKKVLSSAVQRLQRFGTYGRLKQIALRGIVSLDGALAGDDDQLAALKAAFAQMDPAGAGRVPYSAVVDYLRGGGFDLSDTELEILISQMDSRRDGYVRYEEWLAALLEWREVQESPGWEALCARAFEAFDGDGGGRIGVRDLRRLLCEGGSCPMDDVVGAALRDAGSDEDGEISLDDFVRLVQQNRADNLSIFEDRRLPQD